jgi:hypothetical protein
LTEATGGSADDKVAAAKDETALFDAALHETLLKAFGPDKYEFSGDKISQTRKVKGLVAFAKEGIQTDACIAADISRKTWYHWREVDPEFARAFADAEEFAVDALERCAVRRGKVLSDHLLTFLLKGNKPGKFKDRTEVTGANGRDLPGGGTTVIVMPSNNRGDDQPPQVIKT